MTRSVNTPSKEHARHLSRLQLEPIDQPVRFLTGGVLMSDLPVACTLSPEA